MGKYVGRNLLKNEKVEYETTYHWIIFFNLYAILTFFLSPIIQRISDEFVITNKRVIVKTGLIRRKTFEIGHSKIESVTIDQSFFGKIFNYGSIRIIGSGGSNELFPNIQNPSEFRRIFQEFSL